ncbi:MAG TPA: phosphate ABC transporter ATP-binding protein [Trebonia sp.]|jgi:phosphate transport system ATP-binding protein|nr:phosphate ABC transporter ATP-binding protein [Trebonia sp.]
MPVDAGQADGSAADGSAADKSAAAVSAADQSSAAAMSALRLTLGYGTNTVLTDVSVDFHPGQVTALLGPTGSGKSTLLRTLNRMNDKISGYRRVGDVTLDGQSIWSPAVHPMALRRNVGMLFQRPNPFPMSIMDNVVAGVRAHQRVSRARLKELAETRLRAVGLWDAVSGRLNDSPFRLSGGQQQLLCLARALAVSPSVLLLDEPTSSLDPVATESIEELIRGLVPELTVVIVTHNLAQARRVSHRSIFLNRGRVVEQGATDQIFESPAEEETAQYVGGRFG